MSEMLATADRTLITPACQLFPIPRLTPDRQKSAQNSNPGGHDLPPP